MGSCSSIWTARSWASPSIITTHPDVVSATVALGDHELTAGDHTLTVEIVGANEKAVKAYMFGISSITCEPVKP